MSKNNCIIKRDDIFTYLVMTPQQSSELFGDDYIEDYGDILPDELMNRAISVRLEYEKIQKEIREFLKKKDETTHKQYCYGCHKWLLGVTGFGSKKRCQDCAVK